MREKLRVLKNINWKGVINYIYQKLLKILGWTTVIIVYSSIIIGLTLRFSSTVFLTKNDVKQSCLNTKTVKLAPDFEQKIREQFKQKLQQLQTQK